MSVEVFTLPKNKTQLACQIESCVLDGELRFRYTHTVWLLAWYYLNGARRFDRWDPVNGIVAASFVDEGNRAQFQSQELIAHINKLVGRITALDLLPKVVRNEFSLSAIKDKAISQVILDSLVSSAQVSKVARDFAYIFTTLGCCGIVGHVVDHPTIGLTSDLEVVHPREILPWPSLGTDHTKQRGIIRQRLVPLQFLVDQFGSNLKKAESLEMMDYYETSMATIYTDKNRDDDYYPGVGATGMVGGTGFNFLGGTTIEQTAGDSKRNDLVQMVKVRELWIDGPAGTCSQYVITSGKRLLEHLDFSRSEVYCPLGFSRFFDNGTFYGMGMFQLMFGIVRELELLLKSLFTNIKDTDRYGVVLIPHGMTNDKILLRDVGTGLRAAFYTPAPEFDGNFNKPMVIQPFNTGDAPGKAAALAKQFVDSLNPVQDLLAEKGRVDSFSGLQFLDEQINRSISSPINGVEQAFSACYRGLLSNSSKYLAESPRAIPVSKLTLDLAGVSINPENGEVSFPENPLPIMNRIGITVRETSPRSEATMKSEALELMKVGLSDAIGFRLFAMENGINIATWMREDVAAYELVVRNILLLFNDGQTPGQVIITPHTSKPDIQLRVLTAFMGGPTLAMASVEVQNEFIKYRESLMNFSGFVLPDAVPNPDDVAMLSQFQQQAQGPMGGPSMMGGGPPPMDQGVGGPSLRLAGG